MTTLDSSQSNKDLRNHDKPASPEIPSEYPGFPRGMSPLESQLAGHSFNDEKYNIGMLRGPDGRVLKPVTKPLLGKREISFYENIWTSRDALMLQLKNYVPRYYGTTELQIFGRRVTFLTLRDITEGMAEPCVMDIKIGRRTWDPLATAQKRATEELKYAESKRTYGFCITGFQVYCLSSGQLRKFGKHYGKTLDARGVVEALKIFLNISPERPPCRQLIVKLLSSLWKILLFFRTQRTFRFYSSSLLVAYDAWRLRRCLRPSPSKTGTGREQLDAASKTRAQFLKRSISLSSEHELTERAGGTNRSSSGSPEVDRLCRTHSYVNNFDDDIVEMKEDYEALLNELSSPQEVKENWVRINMIDFTHVFPAEEQGGLDLNYLEGIENLIKLIETFLKPSNI